MCLISPLRLAALAALLLPLPIAGHANDAVAGLDAGELVMRNSDAVEMAEEDLFLSLDQVRVRYLFRNRSKQPVTTLVAFPLPPIHMEMDHEYGFTARHRDPADSVDFRLWIDGRPVPVNSRARAETPEGREVTALLQKWQIPLIFLTPDAASYDRLMARLEALPPEAMAELRAAGAILQEPDMGFQPNWITHFSYYWQMTFPAGAAVEVRHAYVPVPEAFIFGRYDLEEGALAQEVCMDNAFRAGARRLLGPDEYAATTGRLLRYVLTTANSWRGPIGRFHLTIDKGRPDALVSLCRDGIRKTGATRFEWQAQNWQPRRNLSVLFLAPPG